MEITVKCMKQEAAEASEDKQHPAWLHHYAVPQPCPRTQETQETETNRATEKGVRSDQHQK